jgi:hypothetical protein
MCSPGTAPEQNNVNEMVRGPCAQLVLLDIIKYVWKWFKATLYSIQMSDCAGGH